MLKEQNQNLKALFQWLIEKGLNQNKSKCEFRKDKLEFFGYVSSKDSISPVPKKVADVVNLQTTSTASEYAAFWGWRTTVRGSSLTTLPRQRPCASSPTGTYHSVGRKDMTTQSANYREALVSAPVTAYFDPQEGTEICWCKSSQLGNHPLTSRPENWGKSC